MSEIGGDESRARAAAEAQLEAYNRRDIEAFMACYAPDVEVWALGGARLHQGAAAMRPRYERLFGGTPNLHCELVQRLVIGRFVFDEERVTGLGPEPRRVVATYEVRADGLIGKVWFAAP